MASTGSTACPFPTYDTEQQPLVIEDARPSKYDLAFTFAETAPKMERIAGLMPARLDLPETLNRVLRVMLSVTITHTAGTTPSFRARLKEAPGTLTLQPPQPFILNTLVASPLIARLVRLSLTCLVSPPTTVRQIPTVVPIGSGNDAQTPTALMISVTRHVAIVPIPHTVPMSFSRLRTC